MAAPATSGYHYAAGIDPDDASIEVLELNPDE